MSVSFKIDASEITDMIDYLTSDRIKEKMLTRMGVRGENELKAQAKTISTSSKTHNSITSRANSSKAQIYTDVEYADVSLEYGRKPGKVPPIRALERWRVRKGVTAPAAAIAKSIARRGTAKYRAKGPKLVTKAFNKISGRIVVSELNKYLGKI